MEIFQDKTRLDYIGQEKKRLMFGNLTTEELASKLGITLTEDEFQTLEKSRKDNPSDVGKGTWHFFRFPLCAMAGDKESAYMISDIFISHAREMSRELKIGYYGIK